MNRGYVGRQFTDPEEYEVSREAIRAFADATGHESAVHRDVAAARAAGHPDVIAPPTFPVIVTRAANRRVTADPALRLDYDRVLHGSQSFTISRCARPGDRLTVTVHIDDIRDAGAHELIELRDEVRTAAGEHLCTARSTLIVVSTGGQAP
ncbi:MaoC family dehydratase N-terminal domain-containing protein [Solwaraspora sp. WMMD1047]|uniref:FAS1-like dehydratase domain-containing protein n=1 Tax=Solwaraspora sp. WMMD1047 TaxID=3016102 RepID=UPI002416419B|nr:MaoC family dehydratase N-terminal domain-containing protein [Solwaraspora sp. WMMD1047]MDG4834385.1 MaoC family dehydratase N-terminal domain-containing protein [Solwaraspora sp. WMMD1047]